MSESSEAPQEETRVREYYEQDGTKVVETITLIRIQPKSSIAVAKTFLEVDSRFYHQFLEFTNELRARHQSPPLTLYKDLNQYAAEWARHLAKINKCIHREQKRYAENLYYKYAYSKIRLDGYEPVQSWYDEIEDYKPYFGRDPPKSVFPKVGHFTNLVWKNSKRMGVSFCKGANTVYVVCYYDPPGNIFTAFKDNVLPPVTDGKPTPNRMNAEESSFFRSGMNDNGVLIKSEYKPAIPEAKRVIIKKKPKSASIKKAGHRR